MMKTAGLLLLTIIISISCSLSVFANLGDIVSDVSTLDLSSGQIAGEKAEYYFMIPSSWQGKVQAEREKLKSSALLEKINFYYKPENKVFKPVFLLSLYVYDKKDWSESLSSRKLLETERYVFCVYSNSVNRFEAKVDKAQFQRLISDAADNQFIKNCIALAGGNQILPEYTVTVNGSLLEGSTAVKKNNLVYLPLRSVCEVLGYRVGWSKSEQSIVVLRGRFYYSLYMDNNIYGAYIQDGKTYLSSMFFIQIMKVNVEIDDRCNVYIRG